MKKEIYIKRGSRVGVLMLHSFTSTPQEFANMANFLANKNLTVYAPMIAGHGTSVTDLANTTIGQWQSSVEQAYLKLSKVTDKVYILGNSFGGNLAFDLAVKFSHSVEGIISLGTPIKVRRNNFSKFLLYTYGNFVRYKKKLTGDYPLLSPYDKKIYYSVMPIKSLRRFFKFIAKFTVPNLKKVISPTLIIQSRDDHTVHPISANLLHQNIRSKKKKIMWVDGSSHNLSLGSGRGLVYQEIYKFIAG